LSARALLAAALLLGSALSSGARPGPAAAAPPSRTPAPRPVPPPACAYCRMALEQPAFGGTVVTTAGRRLRYDAIECMAAAVLTDSVPSRAIRSMSVTDHAPPHRSLDVRRAVFLLSPGLHSPMGLDLSAHAGDAAARAAQRRHAGERLDWRGVLAHVNHAWFQDKLDVGRHARPPGAGGK
jgi:hypothetical protein